MGKLKRELGIVECVLIGIGIILGVGIYTLIGKAAGIAGNAIWLSFAVGAVVATFTGLSYAELSSIFPKAGAEYVYTKRTFGKAIAFLVGFLIIIGTMFAAATVSLGFAGYFTKIINLPIPIIATILILFLSLINFYGIKETASAVVVSTIIEATGLLLVILIGIPNFGIVNYFELPPNASFTNVMEAAALLFFAYLGFESITRLAEETKKPEKTIPKALLISIAISSIIYILVGIAAVSVISWQELAASNAPLADVIFAKLGKNVSIMLTIIALFATANTALIMLVTDTRILYGMAKEKIFPKILTDIHKERHTPWIAAAVIGILSVALISIGDIEFVANATNFTVFITFVVVNFAVIWLRQKGQEGKFKVPFSVGNVPILSVLGASTSILLMISLGSETILAGIVILIIGIATYLIMKKLSWTQVV